MLAEDSKAAFSELRELSRFTGGHEKRKIELVENVDKATERLTHHFEKVLNTRRGTRVGFLDSVLDLRTLIDVDWGVPPMNDVIGAARRLERGKAPDLNGVHAEMIRACLHSDNDNPSVVARILHNTVETIMERRPGIRSMAGGRSRVAI